MRYILQLPVKAGPCKVGNHFCVLFKIQGNYELELPDSVSYFFFWQPSALLRGGKNQKSTPSSNFGCIFNHTCTLMDEGVARGGG